MAWQEPKLPKAFKNYSVRITIEERTFGYRDDIPVELDNREMISLSTRSSDLRSAIETARTHLKVYADTLPDDSDSPSYDPAVTPFDFRK